MQDNGPMASLLIDDSRAILHFNLDLMRTFLCGYSVCINERVDALQHDAMLLEVDIRRYTRGVERTVVVSSIEQRYDVFVFAYEEFSR